MQSVTCVSNAEKPFDACNALYAQAHDMLPVCCPTSCMLNSKTSSSTDELHSAASSATCASDSAARQGARRDKGDVCLLHQRAAQLPAACSEGNSQRQRLCRGLWLGQKELLCTAAQRTACHMTVGAA